eukprot:maker-scaffold_9-snap-gene-4.8-mRNA-1 protein AED:0.01 eAED:0.54 QI:45/1/0.75/1/1/1/4/44/438
MEKDICFPAILFQPIDKESFGLDYKRGYIKANSVYIAFNETLAQASFLLLSWKQIHNVVELHGTVHGSSEINSSGFSKIIYDLDLPFEEKTFTLILEGNTTDLRKLVSLHRSKNEQMSKAIGQSASFSYVRNYDQLSRVCFSSVKGVYLQQQRKHSGIFENAQIERRPSTVSTTSSGEKSIFSQVADAIKEVFAPKSEESLPVIKEDEDRELPFNIKRIPSFGKEVQDLKFSSKDSAILWTERHRKELNKNLPKSAFDFVFTLGVHSCFLKLLYTFDDHGVSLSKLYKHAYGHQHTLLLIKSTRGDIFGFFATEELSMARGRSFYGTGESFIFTYPNKSTGEIEVFHWTEKNSFFFSSSSTHLAVGSGPHGFALCLTTGLNQATSFPSDTYGNTKPLCVSEPNQDSTFTIANLELFGFEHHQTEAVLPIFRRRSVVRK